MFVHDPDLGSLLMIFGKKASSVNGIANANPNPNIPKVRSTAPPSDVRVPTSNVPRIGPVHENETKQRVNDIKNVEIKPLYILDFESTEFDQEFGRLISNIPNNEREKAMNITKKIKLSRGLVDI